MSKEKKADKEIKMLKYVIEHAKEGSPKSVLDTIDKYCW
jgi:hypothetical protein